jgi:hypothetical protein
MDGNANKGTGGNAMLDDPGFEPQRVARLSGSIQIGLKPIHPSTWGYSFLGIRGLEHGADHSPLLASGSSMGTAIFLPLLFDYPTCNGTALPFIGNKRKKEGH